MRSTEIAVVGSLNLDITVRVERLPEPGETVLGSGHATDTGGKGANQAVAAARLGRSVAMIGAVGRDDAGERLLAALLGDGVETMTVQRLTEAATGLALITVDELARNTIVVDPGANGELSPERIERLLPAISNAGVVMLQLEIPVETVVAAATAASGTVILNPAPARELPGELLGRIDVLVPNETELGLLAGTETPDSVEAVIAAASRIPGPGAVVATLGADGAVLIGDGDPVHVPAPSVQAVDPTAAGDSFCAGMADALARGLSLEEAVHWAVLCGAVTVTRPGAQASLPTRDDVEVLTQ